MFTAEDKRRVVSQESCFTPKQVSNILDADLGKLKQLCKEHNVAPQKDFNSGKTFFLQKDVEFLQSIKELHQRSRQISEEEKFFLNRFINIVFLYTYRHRMVYRPVITFLQYLYTRREAQGHAGDRSRIAIIFTNTVSATRRFQVDFARSGQ